MPPSPRKRRGTEDELQTEFNDLKGFQKQIAKKKKDKKVPRTPKALQSKSIDDLADCEREAKFMMIRLSADGVKDLNEVLSYLVARGSNVRSLFLHVQRCRDALGLGEHALIPRIHGLIRAEIEAATTTTKKAMDCCSICYQASSSQNVTTLECGHEFHTTCISKWLKVVPKCPMCRFELSLV